MPKVVVVGVGPGGAEYLPPVALEAIRGAEVLVGGEKVLARFAGLGKEQLPLSGDLDGVLARVASLSQERRVAVLLSGDPGFFSLLPRLREHLGPENLEVVPGISSLQLACARLAMNWEDLRFVSVHGRGLGSLSAACCHPRVAVLTDHVRTPAAVCRYFLERGCSFRRVWVLSELGSAREEVIATDLAGGAELEGRGNSIVILEQGEVAARGGCLQEPSFGLPDAAFFRGEAVASREEVRAVVLSKARLRRGMVVYDIGAGAGTWTVAAARLVSPGVVFAVEKSPEALHALRQNLESFGVENVVLVAGEAPEACASLPPADCVLIGGSGGRLSEILAAARGSWLRPGGTVVLALVTPDSFAAAWGVLAAGGWRDLEAVLLAISRVKQKGAAHLWSGEAPVFLLRAVRSEEGGSEEAGQVFRGGCRSW